MSYVIDIFAFSWCMETHWHSVSEKAGPCAQEDIKDHHGVLYQY